jgi:DNA-binding transcriptional regulator YbjK
MVEVADAAIQVLATAGARGFTHRAVDRELGLPPGSTGNYFSTRAALLATCAERLAELDLQDIAAASPHESDLRSPQEVGDVMAAFLLSRLEGAARLRQLARLELLLEATRTEPLKRLFAELRWQFIQVAEQTLVAAGAQNPGPCARALVATFDGLLFDQLLYPSTAVDHEALAASLASSSV